MGNPAYSKFIFSAKEARESTDSMYLIHEYIYSQITVSLRKGYYRTVYDFTADIDSNIKKFMIDELISNGYSVNQIEDYKIEISW